MSDDEKEKQARLKRLLNAVEMGMTREVLVRVDGKLEVCAEEAEPPEPRGRRLHLYRGRFYDGRELK